MQKLHCFYICKFAKTEVSIFSINKRKTLFNLNKHLRHKSNNQSKWLKRSQNSKFNKDLKLTCNFSSFLPNCSPELQYKLVPPLSLSLWSQVWRGTRQNRPSRKFIRTYESFFLDITTTIFCVNITNNIFCILLTTVLFVNILEII